MRLFSDSGVVNHDRTRTRGCVDEFFSLGGLENATFALDDFGHTGDFCKECLALRCSGLEQFFNARQTLRNVGCGHTTRVEGTHRELGTRFTDRLSGDDTNGGTEFHELVVGQVRAVALLAQTTLELTGEQRAHVCGLDLFALQTTNVVFIDEFTFLHERILASRILDVLHEDTAMETREQWFTDFFTLGSGEHYTLRS